MRSLSLLAALLVIPCVQDPKPAPPATQTPEKPLFPLGDAALAAHLNEQVEGAWQLQSAQAPDVVLFPGDTVGYALFHDGYVAVEIHGQGLEDSPDTDGQFFESGVHRYTIDGAGVMKTSLLIGTTNLTEDYMVQWMAPGGKRTFHAQFLNDVLTLTRVDGLVLTFKKLGKLPFPGVPDNVDAFGRPVGPKPTKPTTDKPIKKQ